MSAMTPANRVQPMTVGDADALGRMIGPDEHRPGSARARLFAEQIPAWAIVGYIGGMTGATEAAAITEAAIAQVAAAYGISHEAVRAAVLCYDEHRRSIDALLAANAAALA
jgi:hypothetical protein